MGFTYTKPRDLQGQVNGKLTIPLELWHNFKIHPIAYRSLKAMEAHANKDKVALWATGIYRPYVTQVKMFNERYVDHYIKGETKSYTSRTWNGVGYYQRLGTAAAATPGTSNHGWALAADFATKTSSGGIRDVIFDPDNAGPIPNAYSWLTLCAGMYGWSWQEGRSTGEPWHWVYISGDVIPVAVLQYEGKVPPVPPPSRKPGWWSDYIGKSKATVQAFSRDWVVAYLQSVVKLAASQAVTVTGDLARGVPPIFDGATDVAVKNVQTIYKLTVDGVVGSQTWTKIDELATNFK